MSNETNLLRAQTKRFAAPVVALALTVSAGAFVFSHNHVHAAMAADNPIVLTYLAQILRSLDSSGNDRVGINHSPGEIERG